MSVANEEVLVFSNKLINVSTFKEGFQPDNGDFLEFILKAGQVHFMDRAKAEVDENFRQLIPYGLIKRKNKYLTYRRTKKGGETRLHAKKSLGIGGHINPVDGTGHSSYYEGFYREVDEEVRIDDGFKISVIGTICDNSNAVGRVHFGIVHLIEPESDNIELVDPALSDIVMNTLEELKEDRESFESWSQLIIDYLAQQY